ncbi:MAG: DUF2986 domain-containing protein [Gammaproteobacteria bacterium]|nr:DUF2986 domain-containing protein [Gammaproteobacteria bacterium]
MNRKKKIDALFKKCIKPARAKLGARSKAEPYIKKADRAKAAAQSAAENTVMRPL